MGSSLERWIKRQIWSGRGKEVIKRGYRFYQNIWFGYTSRRPIGTNVFTRDWDALLILDACRVDALREVAPEYDFVETVDSITSVGSTSSEWITNTFTTAHSDKINDTVYVSSNAFADRVLRKQHRPPDRASVSIADWRTVDQSQLEYLDIEQWKGQDGCEYMGGFNPPETTERAIRIGRERDFERLIVHYSVPHKPFRVHAEDDGKLAEYEKYPFKALRNGHDFEEIWEAYLDNLRWALDSVAVLLENLDAPKVVLSADHGEGFGEWGIYEHGGGYLSPHVKKVPWAVTEAQDTQTVEPDIESPDDTRTDEETEEQLRNLGYFE